MILRSDCEGGITILAIIDNHLWKEHVKKKDLIPPDEPLLLRLLSQVRRPIVLHDRHLMREAIIQNHTQSYAIITNKNICNQMASRTARSPPDEGCNHLSANGRCERAAVHSVTEGGGEEVAQDPKFEWSARALNGRLHHDA